MSVPVSAKAELHALIDTLSNEYAERLLDYVNMRLDPDELSPEEQASVRQAMEEFERGETMSGEQLKRELGIGL